MAAFPVVGAAAQAAGSLLAGQSEANSLNSQADLQIKNAKEAEAQGAFNANKSTMNSGQKIGETISNVGASGVSSNSGSVQSILAASAANAEMDRLNILHGADIKAINYQNEASMERAGAKSAVVGSLFSAFGYSGRGAANAYANKMGSSGPGNVDGSDAVTNSNAFDQGPSTSYDSLNSLVNSSVV